MDPRHIKKPCPEEIMSRVRKERPLTIPHSKYDFRRGVKRSASDSNVRSYKKELRVNMKRSRAAEDVSSGTTISKSCCEPRKKKRKGGPGLCSPRCIRADFSMKTIYKNPKFSCSRESVVNIAPPRSSCSLESFLFHRIMVNSEFSGFKSSPASLRQQASSKVCSKNKTRVAMVTEHDGHQTQITMKKAVLMHVRETPAQAKPSMIDVRNGNRLDLEGTSHLDCSNAEFNTEHELNNSRFIHHVSSLELLRNRSSTTYAKPCSKRPHVANPTSYGARARHGIHCRASDARCSKIPKIEGTSQIDIDGVQIQTTDIGDNLELNVTNKGRQMKLAKRKLPSDVANPSSPSRAYSSLALSTSSMAELNKNEHSIVPCAFLVCVCFILSRLLNIIY